MLCQPMQMENTSGTMVPVSPLRSMHNRCQVSPPAVKDKDYPALQSHASSCGSVMRLPSKRRLMVRTWLPAPIVQSYHHPENHHSTKRRVRFSGNGDDVGRTVHRYAKPSVRHYPNLYFSSQEKAEIQFLASSVGEAFLFEEEEKVENLEKAFYSCDWESLPTTDRTVTTNPRLKREFVTQESIRALQEWAETEARGLEDVVSSEFQDTRCRTIAMILEYQDYLRQTMGTTVDSDELLRVFAEKASARSRRFSTLMALGDANAAKREDQENKHLSVLS